VTETPERLRLDPTERQRIIDQVAGLAVEDREVVADALSAMNKDPEVEHLIAEFTALEARDRREFASAVADNVLEPDPAETEALRSDALILKSLSACEQLLARTEQDLRRRRRGSAERRRTLHFFEAVGRERRLLERIVAGRRAEKGILPNAPNPRQRALRRLADENLKGDVPQGRFRDVLEEEKERDRARLAAEKEARRQARREARGQAAS
jgi:hypothetical protein